MRRWSRYSTRFACVMRDFPRSATLRDSPTARWREPHARRSSGPGYFARGGLRAPSAEKFLEQLQPLPVRRVLQLQIEPGRGAHDGLEVRERAEALFAVIAAHAAEGDAAGRKGSVAEVDKGVIDAAAAKGNGVYEIIGESAVLAEDI